jgi:hypothetical protein
METDRNNTNKLTTSALISEYPFVSLWCALGALQCTIWCAEKHLHPAHGNCACCTDSEDIPLQKPWHNKNTQSWVSVLNGRMSFNKEAYSLMACYNL